MGCEGLGSWEGASRDMLLYEVACQRHHRQRGQRHSAARAGTFSLVMFPSPRSARSCPTEPRLLSAIQKPGREGIPSIRPRMDGGHSDHLPDDYCSRDWLMFFLQIPSSESLAPERAATTTASPRPRP